MKKLVAMLSALPEPAMMINRDMLITYQNEASIRGFGGRLGVKCHAAIEADESPCLDCPAVRAFDDGLYHQMNRRSGVAALGKSRFLEVCAVPLMDESGETTECVVLQRDLTAVKEVEERKRDLLSMLSHDLKSPMTVIHSYTELMLDAVPEPDRETGDMLRCVKRAAELSAKLLDDFVTLSRIETGAMTLSVAETSLASLAEVYAEQYSAVAREKSITLHVDLERDLPTAYLDERQCGRVISNIIANAIKYSGPGTKVWVRAGVHLDGPGRVFLEVADEGPGIPEDELPFVLERYYRKDLPNKAQGSGLGLTIVKAITEMHRGTVEITNRAEGGTKVRVVLPTGGGAASDS